MIISCPNCSKKFQVPDNAISKTGRTVQCSSCSHEWMQYPIKEPKVVKLKNPAPIKSSPPVKKARKIQKKASGPAPYSKEYMQQKWGSTVQNYAVEKGLSKKNIKIKKQKSIQSIKTPSFGFFNYIITISVFSIFFIGILNFERTRLSRKFPVLEPYIDHFFESLEIFKILILDFFR